MKQTIDMDQALHRLQEERKKLLKRIRESADQAQKGRLTDSDMEEQAALSTMFFLQSAMQGYNETQLARIEKAIERLQQGNYGKCLKCSKDIQPGRLRAMPYAELCIQCQSRKEETF
jgi:RNA polymerase-binding transcription factor